MLVNTGIPELIIPSAITGPIKMILLFIFPISFMYYIFAVLNKSKLWTLRVATYINVVIALIMFSMQIAGVMDIYQLLWIFHVIVSVLEIIAAYSLINSFFRNRDATSKVGIGGILDIIYYYFDITGLSYFFVCAFLIFIIIPAVYLLYSWEKVVHSQATMDTLTHLAYKDALTNIRNRHAYEQTLAFLNKPENIADQYGIGIFDVNGLKEINCSLNVPRSFVRPFQTVMSSVSAVMNSLLL